MFNFCILLILWFSSLNKRYWHKVQVYKIFIRDQHLWKEEKIRLHSRKSGVEGRVMAASGESNGSRVRVTLNWSWNGTDHQSLGGEGPNRSVEAKSEIAFRWRLCTESTLKLLQGNLGNSSPYLTLTSFTYMQSLFGSYILKDYKQIHKVFHIHGQCQNDTNIK